MRIALVPLVLFPILITLGCTSQSAPAATTVIAWRSLGSWSGRGSTQTESFMGETGSLRVRWETRNEKPAGTGTFRVTINSAISGRVIGVPVEDHKGAGQGTGFMTDDPRVYYAVVESENVEWSFTVEEGVAVTGEQSQ